MILRSILTDNSTLHTAEIDLIMISTIEPLKHADEELTLLYDNFINMSKHIASTETLKTDFISSVSHEIKNPIAVIQNYASYLKNENLTTEQMTYYIDTIFHASSHLSELVNDILNMNKLEHMQIPSKSEPYSLDEQIRLCATTYIDFYESKNIVFNAELESIDIDYDKSLMELLWNNLISNAMKYTPPDGQIDISLKKQNDGIFFSIKDTGCGMDKTTCEHIFDKFYQGDTSHNSEGNGLGLAMVKKICDLYNAKITVESTPGIGSVFMVVLKQ